MTVLDKHDFVCNVCSHTRFSRTVDRGDGRRVLFCESCEMGVVEAPPADTSVFYGDDYYGKSDTDSIGYADYAFTAEHGLLWVQLLIRALKSEGRVLDIGCADGFLLRKLGDAYQRFGIEVNQAAAKRAVAAGISIISDDVLDPAISAQLSNSLDIVTSIATFEHVLDLKSAFARALSLLKPDGVMIFEIPLISETRDNDEWFNGSYEHIYYPTVPGLERLFACFENINVNGFESGVNGYGSTYIGVVTRTKEMSAEVDRLVEIMLRPDPKELDDEGKRLNLSYNVIHSFFPTPDRILALPVLLEKVGTPALITRLMQMWYADSLNSGSAKYQEAQAKNWRDAYEQAEQAAKAYAEARDYWIQQSSNWEQAYRDAVGRTE